MAFSILQHTISSPPSTVTSAQVQRPSCPLRPCRPPSPSALARWAAFAPLAATGSCRAAPFTSGSVQAPQRRARCFTAASEGVSGGSSDGGSDPKLAADAIAAGLQAYQSGDHDVALDLFQRALKLPGTGLKRYRDKPREASEEERQAALYNTACCLGAMGETQDGLKAIAGALEAGYTDYQQLRRDPDLAPLRDNDKFEGLLKRFEPGAGFLGTLLKGFGN